MTTAIPKLEMELSKCSMQAESVAKRIDELAARLADMSGKTSSPAEADVARLEQLKRSLAVDEKDLAKISKIVDALGAEIATLQAKVLEAGGNRLKAAKSKAETVGERLNEAVSARTRYRVRRACRADPLLPVSPTCVGAAECGHKGEGRNQGSP